MEWEIVYYEYGVFVKSHIILEKTINLNIYFVEVNKSSNFPLLYQIGTLNSVKPFIQMVQNQKGVKIKKFYIGEKEINFQEDKSFGSIGIKEDSDCRNILGESL